MNVNPVLERELRERVRGRRAAVILTLYLLLLVGFLYLIYKGLSGSSSPSARRPFGVDPTEIARVGRGTFEWLLFVMLLLVMFLVPGMTSGAIAGERERQTLIPMQVTLLKPRSIVLGKISAGLAFLGLLLIASLPLLSLCYVLGGLTLFDVVWGLVSVMITGIFLACLTAACSAFAKRTQTATVLAYALVLLLVVGTFVLYGIAYAALGAGSRSTNEEARPALVALLPNPLMNSAALVSGKTDYSSGVNSPMQGLRTIIVPESWFSYSSSPRQTTTSSAQRDVWVFAAASCATMGALALASVMFAARRIRAPAERER